MCVYLRAKFEVSSIILTSFRQGGLISPSASQNKPLKSPPRLELKANPDQQKKHYIVMFSTDKQQNNKTKAIFLIMLLTLYFAELSTTQGSVKLIYCANQLTISFITDKHCKVKG